MSATRPRLLVYAQDAGGARAIAPVVQRLAAAGLWDLQILVHLFAPCIFRELKIPAQELRTVAGDVPLTERSARRLLAEFSPRALFCTTSNNRFDPSNGALVAAARTLGIPSLGLMDHWKGWDRFHEKDRDFRFLPDRVGVIDAWSLARGTREKIDRERMVAVGHARLESLFRSEPGFCRRSGTRRELPDDEFVCTLFTQPVADLVEGELVLRPLLEGNRSQTIQEVFRRCKAYAGRTGREMRFRVHLHPREQAMGQARDIFSGEAAADPSLSALDLALSSHVVFGLDSMILFEAMFSGVPAVSLRIGSLAGVSAEGDLPDLLPRVRTLAELDAWLGRSERERPFSDEGYPLPPDAEGACIRLLEHMTSSLYSAESVAQEARK